MGLVNKSATSTLDQQTEIDLLNALMALTEHSLFASLDEAPADTILGLAISYKADTCPDKVDLGVGAYRTDDGKPYVFQVVRRVEEQMTNELLNLRINKEYLPIDGIPELKNLTQKLLFGDCELVKSGRICSAQSISGTGALRVLANFIATHLVTPKLFQFNSNNLSKPTWAAHQKIFSAEGLDPTLHDWSAIIEVIKKKQLIPLLDTAYQGFASGDLEKDAAAVRLFSQTGMEMFVAQSFAKNFGLYGERVGMLHMVCSSSSSARVALSNLKVVIRSMYSNPPKHGGEIVWRILSDAQLMEEWQNELKSVAGRLVRMRQLLYEALLLRKTPGNWDHLQRQQGMFSFTGLSHFIGWYNCHECFLQMMFDTADQCDRMTKHWHIYLLKNSRISLSGINTKNINYVANAIDECVRTIPFEDSRI
ncbi:aspartate aminotransferase [Cardiosporidium cionae]|uniref:Aspartate aminotransferase n=1 Tax=Cardiosporidium cionae TaxID=476202 RepID=A0ABQ7JFK1_9APIC|nr:aspartate aminotransferase [Cardiosporidium cionae]|eukprot:KAF8822800.1 aspartate aminotransferase [Cardiosporidium cionae]